MQRNRSVRGDEASTITRGSLRGISMNHAGVSLYQRCVIDVVSLATSDFDFSHLTDTAVSTHPNSHCVDVWRKHISPFPGSILTGGYVSMTLRGHVSRSELLDQ